MKRLNPQEIVIVDTVRTANAKTEMGFFRHLDATMLSAQTITALLEKTQLDVQHIENVLWGANIQHIARQASIQAQLPYQTTTQTLNSLEGSTLGALHHAVFNIATQQTDVCIVGGVATEQLTQTHELVARMQNITREAQDHYAVLSHQRAWQTSHDITPLVGHQPNGFLCLCEQDELIQANASIDAFSQSPALHYGTLTQHNCALPAIGASALLVMSAERAKTLQLKPKAVIRSIVQTACDPTLSGHAMVSSTHKALQRADLKLKNIQSFEFFESTAADVLYTLDQLKLKPEQVNLQGGALALGNTGHAVGTQMIHSLLQTLQKQNTHLGLISLSTPLGEGFSIILERV